MNSEYQQPDYDWVRELLAYPKRLQRRLDFFDDTSELELPADPIDRVVFQDRAKAAIRKIAQNRGHILMVGRPGTGKSMLADMFREVLDRSIGDYLRPRHAVVAYPGKDKNHIRIAYEDPERVEKRLNRLNEEIDAARRRGGQFSLGEQIRSLGKVRRGLMLTAFLAAVAGIWLPPAFILASLAGMGAIFIYIQENNHRAQEKIQQETHGQVRNPVKHLSDAMPEILYDPRTDRDLMARVSEPDARNMKGGYRHDPYQSGNLQTPIQKRAYLGAHAKAPIIYVDELKTLIRVGYMPDLLEIMQNKRYILEGGKNTGSGAADRSEDHIRADNIIICCCNHDTLNYLREEGDGAFLSRIEDRGEIIEMESAVPETTATVRQAAQYIRQEILALDKAFGRSWGAILEKEGHEGIRRRSEHIFGRALPETYTLNVRDFSRAAVLEVIKELRCRASDRKLCSILRPVNGIIKTAQLNAILDNAARVEPCHVRAALNEHLSLEGALSRELIAHKKDLKKYIHALTDRIGYVVGLAVIPSKSGGQSYGQPLPIHCQVIPGGTDTVVTPGRTGEIARAAAQNVRASIKKAFNNIGAPYVGYEMHIEYIQAHGGVEGDSASVAMDIGLMSDFIHQPVNQRIGVTGSLTGDIVLAVGGVAEKVRSIMDPDLGMEGACVPWQNKHDIEPLLLNTDSAYIQYDDIPGVRIYRQDNHAMPFDIYFCKTKYSAYKIVMSLSRQEIESRMTTRCQEDFRFMQRLRQTQGDTARPPAPAAGPTGLPGVRP
jgi:Lon-like ATP-dependent protease